MQAAEASFQNQDIPGQKFKAVSAKTIEQVVKWKLNFMWKVVFAKPFSKAFLQSRQHLWCRKWSAIEWDVYILLKPDKKYLDQNE